MDGILRTFAFCALFLVRIILFVLFYLALRTMNFHSAANHIHISSCIGAYDGKAANRYRDYVSGFRMVDWHNPEFRT